MAAVPRHADVQEPQTSKPANQQTKKTWGDRFEASATTPARDTNWYKPALDTPWTKAAKSGQAVGTTGPWEAFRDERRYCCQGV